ncbi:MAG: carbohydrate ABC transporter permease [Chloroflexi bacterium]|nr:carbohydrate ABC transporter permease [Chloroflexota bacterium]
MLPAGGSIHHLVFIPFYTMVVSSFTPQKVLQVDGYSLWPRALTTEAYVWALRGTQVLTGYQVTIAVTFLGTFLSVAIMSGAAYALSNKRFKFRNPLGFYFYFTMLFGGGLIPWYITCRMLGLYDNIWALIVPSLVNPWWIFVIRNYFNSLPIEVLESARIDGASDLQILTRVVLPLSTPVLATAALFVAVGYWNDWWLGTILLDFAPFRPLPVLILRIMNSTRAINEAMLAKGAGITIDMSQIPTLSVRMATAVITIGPIILLYPFVQRYFIKGLTLGAIKG